MRYLITNKDNSVTVVVVMPSKIIKPDGTEVEILGQRRRGNECILYGSEEFVVGDANFDIAELKSDSLKDHTILFHDIQTMVIDKWVPEMRNNVKSHREADSPEIPTDRYFRDAWRDTGKIVVDMPIAREIHKNKLRRARQPLLEKLDADYLRADEQGNKSEKDRIVARKQALRDITAHPDIAKAKTPEELKVAGIDVLEE